VGIDYVAHVPQFHEFIHFQLHGNFDNYIPPGNSMFVRAFNSIIPQTAQEFEQLQQQVAELQRLAQEQAVREDMLRAELANQSAVAQQLQEVDQLESFRQYQAWQAEMSEPQNLEAMPEQSFEQELQDLRHKIDILEQNKTFFKKP
jgi:small-conductance mechanosensitive channel